MEDMQDSGYPGPENRSKHHLYMSDELYAAARVLAERERVRLRRKKYGIGHIVDAAVREYVEAHLTPRELAQLLSSTGRDSR